MYVKALAKNPSRYAPSKVLSIDPVCLFKTLQPMNWRGYVSRSSLCKEL